MNLKWEIFLLLRNTAIVTVAVVVGFMIGAAIGIPAWLKGFCLIPAGFLYLHLTGEKRPSSIKVMSFLLDLAAIGLVLQYAFPMIPDSWKTYAFVLIGILGPIRPVSNGLDWFAKKRPLQKES